MIGFLSFVLSFLAYLVLAGATNAYAKHRWPKKMITRTRYYQYGGSYPSDEDENATYRFFATTLWPFYWIFVWTVTKTNEITFSRIEKHAANKIAHNKVRIADIHATRSELTKSNDELDQAEVELEEELARMS